MNAIKSFQWGGAAFAVGGLLFLANKFNDMSRVFLGQSMPDIISGDDPLLIAIGQATLIAGFVTWFRFYAPKVGRFTKVALYLFSGGGILLALGHVSFISSLPQFEFAFIFVIFGTLGLLAGLFGVGVATLRKPMLGRWQWLPLATGLMGFIGFIGLSGQNSTALFLVFRSLFALGLIALGLTLMLEQHPLQAQSPRVE